MGSDTTIDALAAVTPAEARRAPLRAHRVAPTVALVAPRVEPIPIGLKRIRKTLPNASSTGVIMACLRKPVSMPLCLSATTWSPSRFSLRLAARIIKTNAHTPLSLKLQRTSCVWAVTLPTTKTFEFFFFVSMSCDALFLGSVQDILSGGLPIWRALRLEGCFLCVCDFLSFLSPWMDQLSFRYQMVYAIYGDHNPYSHLWRS